MNPFEGPRGFDRVGSFGLAVTNPSAGLTRSLVDTVVGGLLSAGFIYSIVRFVEWRWQIPMRYTASLALAYVLISGVVLPQPRGDQLGRGGGTIDDPARWSDDVNRALVMAYAVTMPGRLAGVPLIRGMWGLIVSMLPARRSSLPPLAPPPPEAPMRPLRRAAPPPARRAPRR